MLNSEPESRLGDTRDTNFLPVSDECALGVGVRHGDPSEQHCIISSEAAERADLTCSRHTRTQVAE